MSKPLSFGMAVEGVRKYLGLSRTELQRRLAQNDTPIHMTTLRRIESGEQEPKLSDAQAISKALGVSLEVLTSSEAVPQGLFELALCRATLADKTNAALSSLHEWEQAGIKLAKSISEAENFGIDGPQLAEARTDLRDNFDLSNLTAKLKDYSEARKYWAEYLEDRAANG